MLLLVAVGVGVSGAVVWGASLLTQQDPTAHPAIIRAVETDSSYELKLYSGRPISLDDAFLTLEIDGELHQVPLAFFTNATQDGKYWYAGEKLCIVGLAAGCYQATGSDVDMRLVIGESLGAEQSIQITPTSQETTTGAAFTLTSTGVQVHCTANPVLKVIGTDLRHGMSGPPVDVLLEVDEGDGMRWLFGGAAIQSGWTAQLEVEADNILSARGTADYGNQQRAFAPPDEHVLILANGDSAAAVDTDDMTSFLEPYIDVETETATLADDEVLLLYEFSQSLRSALTDYEDAAILLKIGATTC